MTTASPRKPGSTLRPADRIFAGSTIVAGSLILAALASVAVFLIAESIPALVADPAELKGAPTSFWAYVGPLAFGTVWAALLALVMALPISIGIALFISHYAPPPHRAGPRLHHRPAGRRAVGGLRPLGHQSARPGRDSPVQLAGR